MVLSQKEQIIAIIAGGIATYSLYLARNEVPKNTTMFDFILRAMPADLKPHLTIELIDEVFDSVSGAHS